MDINRLQRLLREEFPISIRSAFVPAISKAYALTEALKNDYPIFDWPVAIPVVGHIREVAVEYECRSLIDRLHLPLTYRIAPNANGTSRHLEILSKHFVVSVCQLRSKTDMPRNAVYRARYAWSNQLSLFPMEPNGDTPYDPPYYAIIGHGFRGVEPAFVMLGIADVLVGSWLDTIPLTSEPRAVEMPINETITADDMIDFREHIKEVLRYGQEK